MRIPRPVGRLARALCWLLLSSLALLELLDRTGALASLVRATLLAGLGERAEEVEIEHASFSWKHMVLEIEGLHVVLPGIETQLDQAQVALAQQALASEE